MSTPPPPDGVPLELIDACLDGVAAALHDRPVQQMVAAKLLIETALSMGERTELLTRGIAAVDTAGAQSRDVMWAVSRPHLRAGTVRQDVVDALAHACATPVTVTVQDDVDLVVVQAVVHAVHHVLAGAVLAGGRVSAVAITSDAESVEATIDVGVGSAPDPREPGPWMRLAAARVAAVGGTTATRADAGRRRIRLSAPLAG